MTDASAAIKDAAEEAANSVISAHGIAIGDDESCFETLCWSLGADVPYEKGLLQFAQAIVDGLDLKGLVEAKRMSPKLGTAVVALSDIGERLGHGASVSLDTTTLLADAYSQALAKVGGRLR